MRRSREQLENRQAEMRQRWQAGAVRLRPGRPARQLDGELVFVLALNGVSHAHIAEYFGCDRKTLERHCGPILQEAAQRRARLLPAPIWQRGRNTIQQLAAAATIPLPELSLPELEEMVGEVREDERFARPRPRSDSSSGVLANARQPAFANRKSPPK